MRKGAPPPRTPTIKDVAELAGVGVGTASRVLNGRGDVSPDSRDRVREAMRRLDYRPNIVAQSMRLRTTRAIGCMVADLATTVAAEMVSGAEDVLCGAGYAMLVTNTRQNADRERRNLDIFAQRGVDGALLSATTDEDPALARAFAELDFPIVLWERDMGARFDAVLTDHFNGTQTAVRHLVRLGHRRLALVAAHPGTWVAREQINGFRSAIGLAGLGEKDQTVLVTDDFTAERFGALLRGPKRPTGLVFNAHDVAIVVQTLDALSIGIGSGLSLVSIGDADILATLRPRISAVRGSGLEVGRQAASLLLARLSAPRAGAPDRKLIATAFIERELSGPPPPG